MIIETGLNLIFSFHPLKDSSALPADFFWINKHYKPPLRQPKGSFLINPVETVQYGLFYHILFKQSS